MDENNKNLISEDLTTDANADQQTTDIRDTTNLVLTKYNVDEKFIVAKFSDIEDLRKSYDAIVEHGFPKEEIVLAIVGKNEDEFFKSVDALDEAFKKEDHKQYQYISMGLESSSPEMSAYVSKIWDAHNAVIVNN